jgi:hypothetical protein
MLTDKHILYPEELDFATVVERCRKTLLDAKANSVVWLDERMDWENFIPLVCLEYGISPGWVFTCLQRERSLLGKDASERDFDFAAGVVGQDGPGTINERWNGLPSQIMRAVRLSAWFAGNGPMPRRKGLEPSKEARWQDGCPNSLELLDDKGKSLGLYNAKSKAEYVQLQFTPHLDVLNKNDLIYYKWAPLFW